MARSVIEEPTGFSLQLSHFQQEIFIFNFQLTTVNCQLNQNSQSVPTVRKPLPKLIPLLPTRCPHGT